MLQFAMGRPLWNAGGRNDIEINGIEAVRAQLGV
jgi:hypothetical protein